MKRLTLALSIAWLLTAGITGQTIDETALRNRLETYFTHYKPVGAQFSRRAHLSSCEVDTTARSIRILADDTFAEQAFTPQSVTRIEEAVRQLLPESYADYALSVCTHNRDIHTLIPNRLKEEPDTTRQWNGIDCQGAPWVKNVSSPLRSPRGLEGRHVALWASHGYYYNIDQGKWSWQRPRLFATCEDLFTQTIVVPYLIPMLENAGAVVFTPRERAWQKDELVVDNDTPEESYTETVAGHRWKTAPDSGFAMHQGPYTDGENPFRSGTARFAKAAADKAHYSMVSYQPNFPRTGKYAVYVSYQTLSHSVDDAHYTVWHRGERTEFRVNQRMGGGTWVYLGTFDFDAGSSEFNRVTLSNHSACNGVVTADAVRFGGGMGNIQRSGTVSGMPRALEGSRYYAQWAGMPYSVYSSKNGQDDYGDDINARSNMVNYLAGGSPYLPDSTGLGVPFECSLAVHSDAGHRRDGRSLIGSLTICTTDYNDGLLGSGISRLASRDFADALLDGVVTDLQYKYGKWNRREIYDRNYSETRQPEVPSAIIETLSHQNFADMRYALDPHFRFTLARSLYKTTLRHISEMHGRDYVITPLTPTNFRIGINNKGIAKLEWDAVADPQEPTASPTGYIIYSSVEGMDFDNGTLVRDRNSYEVPLEAGLLYHFKVAAVNDGGRSFTTETLSVLYHPEAKGNVLVINGFHRLSSPALRFTNTEQGFDLDEDPGVTRGPMPGWCGRQQVFNANKKNHGSSGSELEGMFLAGNDFNSVCTHARAIAATGEYNIVSASVDAVENKQVTLTPYSVVDLVLGLEYDDGHSLVSYKAMRPELQQQLRQYTKGGGSLLVSGAYVGTDMKTSREKKMLAELLKCQSAQPYRAENDTVKGLGTVFDFYHQMNEEHYAAVSADVIIPTTEKAFSAMCYADGQSAAVAYQGDDYRTLTIGFPFECIKSEETRCSIMRGILQFLIQKP